jgi:hypothetical protein
MIDSSALCGNCGNVSPYADFRGMQFDDETGDLVLSDSDDPSAVQCPICKYEHTDDDSGPGLWEGTAMEMMRTRRELAADPVWADLWLEAKVSS